MEMYEVPSNGDSETYEDVGLPQERDIRHKPIKTSTNGFRKILLIMLLVVVCVVLFAVIGSLSYSLHICKEKEDACSSAYMCLNGGKCLADNQLQSLGYRCKCADGYIGRKCQYSDGMATDFIVIIQQTHSTRLNVNPFISIAVNDTVKLSIYSFASKKNTSATITSNNFKYNFGSVKIVPNGLNNAGFKIHSSIPIFLHNNRPEAYLAIPTEYASNKYIVASFKIRTGKSVFSLSPVFSRTVVNINFRLKHGSVTYIGLQYFNNSVLTVVVGKGSVFVLSHSSDLSGTLISASKPVVVVSGNSFNYINGIAGPNPFIETMLPINQLDVLYIVPFVARRPDNTVRVLTVEDTNVTVINENNYSQSTIISRDYFDFSHSTISYVQTSNPVMVQLYSHDIVGGEAFMMTIPGVNQYLNEYLFTAPTGYSNNIIVVVETKGVDGFILDGKFVSIPNVLSISEKDYKFSSFSLPISHGPHHLIHNERLRFGLWVYGNTLYESYGYPAGIAYKVT